MSTSGYEGITFASSMRGWRYEELNSHVFGLALCCSLIVCDLVKGDEVSWFLPVTCVLVWTVVSWLMRGIGKRAAFRSQITIGADHLDVVDAGDPSRVPWKDVLSIRIERSASGHRRKVFVRARGGKLFTLLDPEQGRLLELWALGEAREAGVKVNVKVRAYLNAAPAWTFLFYLVIMAVVQFAIARGWF
jgi:hypothetical protein